MTGTSGGSSEGRISASVVDLQSHQSSQAAFGLINAGRAGHGVAVQCREHELFKLIELFSSLRFLVRFAATEVSAMACPHRGPGISSRISSDPIGIEQAIREIELPVGGFQVADKFPDTDLEVHDADVAIHAGQEHSASHGKVVANSGPDDSIKTDARSLQQRLANRRFDDIGEDVREKE